MSGGPWREKNSRCNKSFDQSKIPIEQQICLLKASDVVKEKAMINKGLTPLVRQKL